MEDNELVRKRKSSSSSNQMIDTPSHRKKAMLGFDVDLNLSLSPTSSMLNSNPMPQPPLLEPPQAASGLSRRGRRTSKSEVAVLAETTQHVSGSSRRGRGRGRRISNPEGRGSRPPLKTDRIAPPFVWATDKRATVHSMDYLVSQGIITITGEVQCKKCEKTFVMEYKLRDKFNELVMFIVNEDPGTSHRAPVQWMKPVLPTCKFCDEPKSCKPLISEKKKRINWLFLLLGQLLGCCTLEQLKYFCKHNHNHRTGAKDRVLLLSYFTLCRQLDPQGPFHF